MITTKFDPETLARLEADAMAAEEAYSTAVNDHVAAEAALLAEVIAEQAASGMMSDYVAVEITRFTNFDALQHLYQQIRITSDLLQAARDAKFEAEWPFRFDLQRSGSFPEIRDAHRAKLQVDSDYEGLETEVVLPEMKEWLDEHVGQEGYALRDAFTIGFRDVNHGFHFRVRWM